MLICSDDWHLLFFQLKSAIYHRIKWKCENATKETENRNVYSRQVRLVTAAEHYSIDYGGKIATVSSTSTPTFGITKKSNKTAYNCFTSMYSIGYRFEIRQINFIVSLFHTFDRFLSSSSLHTPYVLCQICQDYIVVERVLCTHTLLRNRSDSKCKLDFLLMQIAVLLIIIFIELSLSFQ